jgi:hypothetical protein
LHSIKLKRSKIKQFGRLFSPYPSNLCTRHIQKKLTPRGQRERLQKTYSQIIEEESQEQQRKTIQQAADEFLEDYRAKHQSATYAEYALGHVSSLLGANLVVEITPKVVKRYQADRLKEKAGPKTINDEVQLLIRLCGEQGALVRATLRRDKALKLPLPPSPGRPYIQCGREGADAGGGAEVAHAADARSPSFGFEHRSPG